MDRSLHNAVVTYVELRDEVAGLEDASCSCGEFYQCENCHELEQASHKLRSHLDLWGEHYAAELGKRIGILDSKGNTRDEPAISMFVWLRDGMHGFPLLRARILDWYINRRF